MFAQALPEPIPESIFKLLELIWPVALLSFVVALITTPICRALATRWRIVDRPDDFLKPHKRPIPYLGGVAIFLGWAAGIAAGIFVGIKLGWFPVRPEFLSGILLAGFAIMLVGLVDDVYVMRPTVKLVLNVAVCLWLFWLGVGRDSFHVIVRATAVGSKQDPTLQWLEFMFSIPLAIFVIVGACNATNLIDGMDGMCSGVLGITSLGFFTLALHLASYGTSDPLNFARLILALAMLGAAVGFLPYNRNPASIFMGDAGSMLLGLNAAVLILLFCTPGYIRWALGGVMVFGLPIADMALTMLRRWRNAKPLMQGDRSHFYDQLVDRGYSVRQVVAISYGLSLAFAVVGCGSAIFLSTRYGILVYLGVFALCILVVWKYRMVELMSPEKRGQPKE